MATSKIMNPNSSAITQNLKSITRVVYTEHTGGTGNIQLPYINDGYIYIIAPYAYGVNCYLRCWVSNANNHWFLTAINPNTGETLNDIDIPVRYLVVETYRI